MLNALTLLVFCQFAGEVIARGADIPIPGPVVGMLLLLLGLEVRARKLRRGPGPALTATAQGLLSNLSLLFVPAGVGVITQLDVLGANWFSILVAIPVSTAAGLAVTGWLFQRFAPPERTATVEPDR